ncbi:MAG: hypothetical protein ACKVOU_01100 [Cytophagales bacterium]
MSAAVKFLFYLSVPFFIIVLMYTYYLFPSVVAIGYSKNIEMQEFREKEWLFYVGGGLFLVFNILIQALKKIIGNLPVSILPAINKKYWLQADEYKEVLQGMYNTWLNGLNLILNLLLTVIFISLYLVNVLAFKTIAFYQPIILGFVVLLGLWFIVLPLRMLLKNVEN